MLLLLTLFACVPDPSVEDSGTPVYDDTADPGTTGDGGATTPTLSPFAASVVRFTPGEGAGFGQDQLPDIVLGSPEGLGEQGSLDVLSLGREGEIVLAFDGVEIVDGEGPDLLVFENPFPGWIETGVVGVSEDGKVWLEWPCEATSAEGGIPGDAEGGFPGCAGVGLVWASSDNGLDATDPEVAGGDAFDLAELGLARASFVRIRDSGANSYDGVAGGFDLDAVAIVNLSPLD